jgi:hypothetical protein
VEVLQELLALVASDSIGEAGARHVGARGSGAVREECVVASCNALSQSRDSGRLADIWSLCLGITLHALQVN